MATRSAEDGQAAALPQALHARVRHLGYVSRGELERLYAQAQAYVSLSRFEGFNMPAAEAASRGVPLILSDLAVHRELYGTQACLVDAQAPAVEAVEAFLRQAGRQGSEQRMAWPHRERCAAFHRFVRQILVQVQSKPEPAALSRFALDTDDAAHLLHQPLADRQPQPGAAVFARGGAVGLMKRLEQAGDFIRRHADAAVLHFDQQHTGRGVLFLQANAHRHRAFLGELDGIADEIEQHLAQAQCVAAPQAGNAGIDFRHQPQTLGARLPQQLRHRVAECQIEILDSTGQCNTLDYA